MNAYMKAFLKIIELLNGQTSLVRQLKSIKPESKIQQGHINNWINRDKSVPAEWVIPCCQVVNFQVTPHEIDSSLYPNPQDGLPEHLRQAA